MYRCLNSVKIPARNFSSKAALKATDLPKYTALSDITQSILAFKRIHHHTLIPRDFVVPHANQAPAVEVASEETERSTDRDAASGYPGSMGGYPLGLKCHAIRADYRVGSGQLTALEIKQLKGVGFVFNPKEYKHNALVRCVELYRQQGLEQVLGLGDDVAATGPVRVQFSFVVPSAAPWPAIMWGSRLAKALANHTGRGGAPVCLDALRAQLAASRGTQPQLRQLPLLRRALTRFHELHGHIIVPSGFVVPTDHAGVGVGARLDGNAGGWPEELWGFRLGRQFAGLCRSAPRLLAAGDLLTAPERGELAAFETHVNALGGFLVPRGAYYTRVLAAFVCFRRIFGHVDVPMAYSVPSPAAPGEEPADLAVFPPELHGYRLGKSTKLLRAAARNAAAVEADTLPVPFVEALDGLGFRWQVYNTAQRVPPRLLLGSDRGDRDSDADADADSRTSAGAESAVRAALQLVRNRLQLARERRAREALFAADPVPVPASTAAGCGGGCAAGIDSGTGHNYWSPQHIVEALECYRGVFGGVDDLPPDYCVPQDSRGTHFPLHLQGMELGYIVHQYLLRYALQQGVARARCYEQALVGGSDSSGYPTAATAVSAAAAATGVSAVSAGVPTDPGCVVDMEGLVLLLASRGLLPRLAPPAAVPASVRSAAGGDGSVGADSVLELELALRLQLHPDFAQPATARDGGVGVGDSLFEGAVGGGAGGRGHRWLARQYSLFKLGLLAYRARHGDLSGMSPRYVVPSGDPGWPVSTWGRPLGAELHGDMLYQYILTDHTRRAELIRLGVTTLSPSLDDPRYQTLAEALPLHR